MQSTLVLTQKLHSGCVCMSLYMVRFFTVMHNWVLVLQVLALIVIVFGFTASLPFQIFIREKSNITLKKLKWNKWLKDPHFYLVTDMLCTPVHSDNPQWIAFPYSHYHLDMQHPWIYRLSAHLWFPSWSPLFQWPTFLCIFWKLYKWIRYIQQLFHNTCNFLYLTSQTSIAIGPIVLFITGCVVTPFVKIIGKYFGIKVDLYILYL